MAYFQVFRCRYEIEYLVFENSDWLGENVKSDSISIGLERKSPYTVLV